MQGAQIPSFCSVSNAHEIDAGCDDALHVRLLSSLDVDAGQGTCPQYQQSKSVATDGKGRPSSRAYPVFDGKVWSSKGFKSFASSKDESPLLRSSWVQRLRPARLEESRDIKSMCIDVKVNTHMANPLAIEYENSRRSKQDFYSSPYAVTAADQYSRVLRAANDGANVPQFPQPESWVAPKLLPTVEALLPSYSKQVDSKCFATERGNFGPSIKCAGFSNEVKQVVRFSAVDRPRVACSSIEGLLDFSSTIPSLRSLVAGKSSRTGKFLGEQMQGQFSTMSTRPTTNFDTENSFSVASGNAHMHVPHSGGTAEPSEGRHSCRYEDSHLYVKKAADEMPSHEPTVSSSELAEGECFPFTRCSSGCPPCSPSFSFHVAENVLSSPSEHVEGEKSTRSFIDLNMSCRRSEKENVNLAEENGHQSNHSSFGTIGGASSRESLGGRFPLPSDFEMTFASAQKRVCGKRDAAKEDIMSASRYHKSFGSDANTGVHCFSRTKRGHKVSCTKEEETGDIHGLQRQSIWSNWMGYKSHVRGTVSTRAFTGVVSAAGSGPGQQACGSSSDSCENMEDGILSNLNETTRNPAGYFSPVGRKQSSDHDKQIAMPSSNVFCNCKSLVTHKLWMQRWHATSSRQSMHGCPNMHREFKTFVGISPFSNSVDVAKHGRIMCSSTDSCLRPAKRICHGRMQYASKEVLPGFQSASRNHAKDKIPSPFMKRFFTPSVPAMAIMGATARQVHSTQPQRKGLFGMWAAPKASRLATPLAQAEKCKDMKIFSKVVKESLPNTKPPTPVDM